MVTVAQLCEYTKWYSLNEWIINSILKTRDIALPTKVCPVKAMVFPVVMYGCERLSTKELMLLNCGAGEDSWEPLRLQGDPTSPS